MKYNYENITKNLNVYIILILFICLTYTNGQNIRFTISGRQCNLPAKFKGIEYNNCIVNEKGQEWCYVDQLGMSWDFCARGDFKIDSSILIKNIEGEKEFCLFYEKNSKRIYSIECDFLLKIKKHNLDFIDTNSFEFFWINKSQIKTKEEEKCLHPVETPIISNNKISYFGFVEIKNCIINDDLTINNSQKWKIDESGRIVNEFHRKCLVRSEEKKKLSDLLKNKIELDFDNEIYDVNIGDCIGNTRGYQAREFWLLEEFKPELLELMALKKLMKVYHNSTIDIDRILSESNKKFLKLIKYNSRLIDYKGIIDDVESKLENTETKLEKFVFDNKTGNSIKDNFNLNGILLEGFEEIYNSDFKDFNNFRLLINSFNIKDSFVNSINFIDLFNNIENNLPHKTQINNNYKILKLSGFFVNDYSDNLFRFKIETNINFMILINSKVIIENKMDKEMTKILETENINFITHSLNQIEIILDRNSIIIEKIQFNISVINSKVQFELDFNKMIPFAPFEEFCMTKKEFFKNLEVLDCNKQMTSINLEDNKFYFCETTKCKNSDVVKDNSICKIALEKNIILPNKGGLLNFTNGKSKLSINNYDFKMIGFDEMITEVKLGYIEDFQKYSREANELIYTNYKIKLNKQNNPNNPDDSFLFYKNNIISNLKDEVLIDAKLICDNNTNIENESNYLIHTLVTKFKIEIIKEKIHDMINGFTIWLYKIKYEDYITISDKSKYIKFVEDIKLSLIKLDEKINHDIFENYNRNVCSINNKNIVLEIKYRNNNENINNLPDFHADFKTTTEEIIEHSNIIKKDSLNIKCLLNENPEIDEKMEIDSNLICKNALSQGLITHLGGVFKIQISNKNLLEYNHLFGLPCLTVFSDNFKTFLNSEESKLLIKNFLKIEKNEKLKTSSFLEMDSQSALNSNKFYSNDLLVKIEQGLNRITDKVIEGSKKISEVSKINEDLNKKFEKVEQGENSIEVVGKRVNEITKLETNLEERVNKKFLKFKKIIKEKEEKIKEIEMNHIRLGYNEYNFKYKINDFFNDWVIVDSLDSKNGPSNWNVNKKEENSLIQTSPIFINNQLIQSKIQIASTIILKSDFYKRNLYYKIKFSSKSFGSIQFNFIYKDYLNYISLQFVKGSDESGSIKLIKMNQGKFYELADLSCKNMLSIMKKCNGYNTDDNQNLIEIYNYENLIQVLFNQIIIFKIEEKDIENLKNNSHFSISINNQSSLVIEDLIIRDLNLEDLLKLKGEENKNKKIVENSNLSKMMNNVNIPVSDKNSDNEVIKPKQKLKYNPLTNNFEVEKTEIKKTEENLIPLALNNKFRNSFIKEKCLKYEKEEYICNYISNVLTKNVVNIQSTSTDDIIKLIKENCISTMKNKFVCDQILVKLEPVKI